MKEHQEMGNKIETVGKTSKSTGSPPQKTAVKLCGLSRPEDIAAVNELKPEYIGFVFASKSKRYVTPERAAELKKLLDPGIKAVGVFVDEEPEKIAELLNQDVIDLAQLHGREDEVYITKLRTLTDKSLIQAFQIWSEEDIKRAQESSADYILLDSGAGTGQTFDWEFLKSVKRPYFLAGGLDSSNVGDAVQKLHPYAVDVSSGIETDGKKDRQKMKEFLINVRSN